MELSGLHTASFLAHHMHAFVVDELELGTRVAAWLDSENEAPTWSAFDEQRFQLRYGTG